MTSQRTISEELLSKLTCTLELELHGMIRNLPSAQLSTIHRESACSSLGLLDGLPVELLFITFNFLDFQSISRISRVSLRGKAVVETLPAYRDMMKNAPEILTALGTTRLLSCHSASLLRETLGSDKCVSCSHFGAFLFLPTCERACFECLHQNPALRMTTPAIAKKCFHLTDKQLRKIPIMRSIPGMYDVRFEVSRRRVYRLVSVKQAKQLGVEVHGSVENLAKLMPRACPRDMTLKELRVFRDFHGMPLQPPSYGLSRLPDSPDHVEDDFGGMASIRFPYLTEVGADSGRICRGCWITYEHQQTGSLPASVALEFVPTDDGPNRPLLAILTRLRSRSAFLEHVRYCYGVGQLLVQWGDG